MPTLEFKGKPFVYGRNRLRANAMARASAPSWASKSFHDFVVIASIVRNSIRDHFVKTSLRSRRAFFDTTRCQPVADFFHNIWFARSPLLAQSGRSHIDRYGYRGVVTRLTLWSRTS